MRIVRRTSRLACMVTASLGALALVPSGAIAEENVKEAGAVKTLTEAYNASGRQLLNIFSKDKGNVVFSPYSVGAAMAMVRSGARGATETELASVLKHRLPRGDMEDASAAATAVLAGYGQGCASEPRPVAQAPSDDTTKSDAAPAAGDATPATDAQPATSTATSCLKLALANGLFLGKQGGAIVDEYVELLHSKYAAEVFRGAGLEEVNAWVGRSTEGKIDKIFDRLDQNASAVLINAVYFKGLWASPFDKKLTKDEPFNLSGSSKVDVPTMQKIDSFAFAGGSGFKAIRLPYNPAAVALVIVLPDKIDGLSKVTAALDGKGQADLFATLATAPRKRMELSLPRFKAAFKSDLTKPFAQVGLKLPFNEQKADFSGMTGKPPGKPPIKISQIQHRAVIEVSEEGTEAAAATGVEIVSRRFVVVAEPEPFRVDRPFLFYVVDDATGAVLFEGRVTDPR